LNQRGFFSLDDVLHTLTSLYWHATIFDHNATPITSKGQLENVLNCSVDQYLHEENKVVYEKVYREEYKDCLGRGPGT